MHYFDPARPRLPNGLPAWLSAPTVALPRLHIIPRKYPEKCTLECMINGSWKEYTVVQGDSLDALLFCWTEDPEAFAKNWFGVETIRAEGAPMLAESLPSIDPANLGI